MNSVQEYMWEKKEQKSTSFVSEVNKSSVPFSQNIQSTVLLKLTRRPLQCKREINVILISHNWGW